MQGRRILRSVASPLAVGVVIVCVLGTGIAEAATGGHFILGKSNYENAPSALTNTKSGPALRLRTHNAGSPAFTVSNGTKIANLNADRIDGLDSSAFVRVSSSRQTLTPSPSPAPVALLAVPGLGTFQWACDSNTPGATLVFAKTSGVAEVDLFSARLLDPPGGGSADAVETLSTTAQTSDLHVFSGVTGPDGKARYVIQLGRPTGRVFTATISLSYQDANVAPSSCVAAAQLI